MYGYGGALVTTWIINAVGLFLTTVGALLVFLYLSNAPKLAKKWLSPEGEVAFAKNNSLLMAAVGLLAVWFLIQCLAVILL